MTIDPTRLDAFLGKVVADIGAAMSAALVVIGDKLGLWRALAGGTPTTPAELARRTDTAERYVAEWLDAMAAGGYVTYSAATRTYRLPPEQALALAAPDSAAFVAGLFQVTAAVWAAESKMAANFRTGAGLEWTHQHPCLFEGTERFFRSAYLGNLIRSWLPALDLGRVVAKLERGARVADVGCGAGASTLIMAQAYPRSRFLAIDDHAPSIERARRRAEATGVADRVTFEVATELSGAGYDLIACFDCLHDDEDPRAAAARARAAIADDGTWLVVEPYAHDRPEHNHTAIGRVYYAASTMLCIPHSLALGGPALGAQAGEARLREVVLAGGWSTLRRATETPFHLVLEARP
jgi:2-polyprenyl-3-methyl-5-hydroxy-6-metoxy-1,4-benzoquinol methylase